jgi:hypothetical protein
MSNFIIAKKSLAVGVTLILSTTLLTSCKVDGVEMAREVCDCVEKANKIPKKSGRRYNKMEVCFDIMDEYEKQLESNPVEFERYEACFPCIDTIIL